MYVYIYIYIFYMNTCIYIHRICEGKYLCIYINIYIYIYVQEVLFLPKPHSQFAKMQVSQLFWSPSGLCNIVNHENSSDEAGRSA